MITFLLELRMKVSCIIPAYNEESTIQKIIQTVKRVRTIDEIIVVDDGSTDKTNAYAQKEDVLVVTHSQNKGKGAALKTGVAHATGDIFLFVDADLSSLTPKKITSILQPLKNDEADFVKTSFRRARGRVTELVVKPLFRVILPFVNFNQPLSGQFAVRRELMNDLKIDDKWGVDIQILLQLVKKGVRITEVDIGELVHKKQPIENLTIMSEQVIRTVLSELGIIANKHKLVIFDFDKTLVQESSIEIIAKKFGFEEKLQILRKKHAACKIKDYEITLALAKELQEIRESDLLNVLSDIHLTECSKKVVDHLKKRQYQIAIVSLAFSPIVYQFADVLGIPQNQVICPVLVKDKNGIYTGEVVAKTRFNSKCCDHILCKSDAVADLMKHLNVQTEECIAVGDGKSDECLFRRVGLSLSYRSLKPIGDVKINHLAEVLLYAE